jgi:hypothetical protein
MSPRKDFHPLQAQEIARAFLEEGVDYLLGTIIASKAASGRQKDLVDLPLLESFRVEYEKRHAPPLRTAADIAGAPPEPS